MFIRDVLPFSHRRYWSGFATEVKRLIRDPSQAFLDAAHQVVDFGVINTDDAIAEGALDDLAGFEAIVGAALEAATPTAEKIAKDQTVRLAIINGEYSNDDEERVYDQEFAYTAGKFLKAYIHRVQVTVGWRYLANHPHLERLREYWLQDLRDEAKDPKADMDDDEDEPQPQQKRVDSEEVQGAFTCSHNTADEADLWLLLLLAWEDHYTPALVSRVEEGSPAREIRLAALTCLVERASGN